MARFERYVDRRKTLFFLGVKNTRVNFLIMPLGSMPLKGVCLTLGAKVA